MPLPINPPTGGYVKASTLSFVGDIALHNGSWFWTYADRWWAAGPYPTRTRAINARARYLALKDGEELRVWET